MSTPLPDSTSDLLLGPVVGRTLGKYALHRKLGDSSMAEVYLARDPDRDRMVALKVLKGSVEEDLKRFLREARLIRKLEHPNIVRLLDIGVVEGRHCISMNYCEGGSLLSSPPASLREGLDILKDVCAAVHYAHGKGVIHRDIKPSNILLDARRKPYLADFGLAKERSPLSGGSMTPTVTGMILGTPGYFSPEQARGVVSDLTGATDIYSLGATLYYLVTRRRPIETTNAVEQITRVVEGDFPPPSALNSTVPREVEAIILKAMALDPARRYASGAEMREDIIRYLRGDEVVAEYEVQAMDVAAQQDTGWRVRRKVLVLTADDRLLERLSMDRLGLYEAMAAGSADRAIALLKEHAPDAVVACTDVAPTDVAALLQHAYEHRNEAARILLVRGNVPTAAFMNIANAGKIDLYAGIDAERDPLGSALDRVLRGRKRSRRSIADELRDTRRQLRAVQDSLFAKNRDLEEKNRYLEGKNEELSQLRDKLVKLATQLQEKNEALEFAYGRVKEVSMMDEVTRVLNWKGFQDAVERDLRIAGQLGQPACLILIEMANLDAVVREKGQAAADAALEAAATTLKRCIRQVDRLGRLSSNRFVIFLAQANLREGEDVVERIRVSLTERPLQATGGGSVRAEVRIGLACEPQVASATVVTELVNRAHAAKGPGE